MNKKNIIEIIFENDQILLINKPTGISVTADRTGAKSILELLSAQIHPAEPLRLVHRLDKETSGILLIAKNKAAQSRYSRLFAKRMIRKLYLAIVNGPLAQTSGSIKDPIARSKRNPQAMHVHPRLDKKAETVWKQVADFGTVCLAAVQPVTGRTHQIRVHFAHRGMPLVIDSVYGSTQPLMLSSFKKGYRPKRDKQESPMIERLTLHAYQLTIPIGPDASETLKTFIAPPDKKFLSVIKLLAKHTADIACGFENDDDLQAILNHQPFAYPIEAEDKDDAV